MDNAVVLKAGMVPLTTLHFNTSNLELIRLELEKKQSEAPALFRLLPCALDLNDFDSSQLDLTNLLTICRQCGLLPVAVRNASSAWGKLLTTLQLADLGRSGRTANNVVVQQTPIRNVRIHNGNIRSGQQIYHDGDLFIFGTVSAGAEVLATGDINVYGALRGRALAGIKGDEHSIIACQKFDAELVSIAGQYRLFDEPHELKMHTVAIRLQDSSLNITSV